MSDEAVKSPFVLRLEGEMQMKGIPDRAALGRMIAIPYHRLNPWWQRSGKPNAADLLTLAKFFDVSQEYLLNGGERLPFQRMAALLHRAESLDAQEQDDLENYLAFLEDRAARRKGEQEPS